jgi:hypothetical protein
MKPGTRHRSQVCATEVIVVRPADVALSCGGHPMIDLADEPDASLSIDPAFAAGSQLGKRYTDAAEILELLVTKPGVGTLAADDVPLTIRAAKALPSSD